MIILCLLSVFVVLGNLLVVSAIWHEHQLHSVTNYLIASLAAADCLVGAVVMPFSIISEVIVGSWKFGPAWCDLWHSFDVLASTASIMNLCAISLDRYLAITNPISYPTKMTPKRVALLIVSLWTCSSLISFPAIMWWRVVGQGPLQQLIPPPTASPLITTTTTMISVLSPDFLPNELEPQYRCVFTDDTYYLLFSSIVSFYGPLCVMLYAYYRIYKAAVQQTRFLKYGSKQVMIGSGNKRNKRLRHISELSNHGTNEKNGLNDSNCDGISNMDSYDRQHLVLRAHRGGGASSTLTINQLAAKGDINNNSNKQRQENGGSILRLSLDDEQESKKGATSIDDMVTNQGHCLKNDGLQQDINHSDSLRSRLNRQNRINLTSSKRDKLRMDSQRFESDQTTSSSAIQSSANDRLVDSGDCLTDNDIAREFRGELFNVLKSKTRTKETSSVSDNYQHLKAISKPSLASINNQSNIVDVSIIDNPSALSLGSPSSISVKKDRKFDLKNVRKESNNIRSSTLQVVCEDRISEDLDASDPDDDNARSSSSSSSNDSSSSGGSYGTGSIASVLVGPHSDQRRPEMVKGDPPKSSCERQEDSPSGYRLRRALSVGDAASHKLKSQWRTDVESGLEANASGASLLIASGVADSINNATNSAQSVSGPNTKGRGDQEKAENGSRSMKTLDIRSWVKMTRPRSLRTSSVDRGKSLMRPPPSLVPLMMINSDTSTDSSLVAIEARQPSSGLGKKKSDPAETSLDDDRMPSDSVGSRRANDDGGSVVESIKVFGKTTSLNANPTTSQAKNLSRNLSFKEEKEKSKGQIIYYDSDKLIQSIVDLTAIHYIDCTNNQSARAEPSIVTETVNGEISIETREKISPVTASGQAQLSSSDGAHSNVPRQQRSVGKKLTKLAKERKAAKTLGIVVGVFILCWLPFFVVNIIVALCGTNCLYKPHILNSVVTWLGWLNSAMNPVIYACWSRDFRRAFRRVLCAWVEFICPYYGAILAKKLRLKKISNYSNTQETYLNRTASSVKGNTSSATIRSGASLNEPGTRLNGGVHKILLSDQQC